MKPLAHALAVAALLAVAGDGRAHDGIQTTEALGRATIEGDVLAARERAKGDALRTCVQQVAATIATAATEADQAQLLSDQIYARSLGYVRRFQILDDRQDGDAWVTRLRCEVSEAKLDDDLLAFGIAHPRAGMPRVLALISEQPISSTRATGWWQGGGSAADLRVVESAFVERLGKSGFAFVDAEVLQEKVRLEAIGADPDVAQARELGAKTGAEIVVIGRAIAKPLGAIPIDDGTFYSAVADVSARVVRTDTGQVIAAIGFTSPAGKGFERATAGRSALSEAGKVLAREVFARVGKVWAREPSGVRRVAMVVRGVDDYGRLAAFKSVLVRTVRGVKDVQERSMDAGQAELDVSVAGTAEAFATDLATRRFQGFQVKVRKVSGNALEVELE